MKKLLTIVFAVTAYAFGVGSLMYLIGFLGGFPLPKTVNTGNSLPLLPAIVVNMALMSVFGLQHSIMARNGFKKVWTRLVPKSIERSMYVVFSGAALSFVMWLWQPIPYTIWEVGNAAGQFVLYGLFALGWVILLLATFLINHFELFGLKQVYDYVRRNSVNPLEFKTPFLYQFVRHPMMVGVLIAIWAIPHMTVGHAIFSLSMTAYVLIGIHFEEKDLRRNFGERYATYQQQVPKLIPSLKPVTPQEVAA